jgi:predicted nucleotidyltransferase
MELENHLSELLDVKVDLVMKGTLKPLIGRRILSEVVGL